MTPTANAAPHSRGLEQTLGTPDRLFSYLGPCFTHSGYRTVHVLCLDSDDRLLQHAWFPQAHGFDESYYRVLSMVFYVKGTSKLVLAHGHDRKSATPHVDERKLRAALTRSMTSLGVVLRDHLVFSWTAWWSFREGRTRPVGQGSWPR